MGCVSTKQNDEINTEPLVTNATIIVRSVLDKTRELKNIDLTKDTIMTLKQKWNDQTGAPKEYLVLCIDHQNKVMDYIRTHDKVPSAKSIKRTVTILHSKQKLSETPIRDKTELLLIMSMGDTYLDHDERKYLKECKKRDEEIVSNGNMNGNMIIIRK